MSIKIILVPIGGNKESMTALQRAVVIADRFGGHIKGLHVMEHVSDAVSFEFHLPEKLRGSVQASAEQSALARADEVRAVFEAVCQQANALIEYLCWHGIASNAVFKDGKGDGVGQAMLNVCAEEEAGFLVVGGFSHARAWLFGGVPRHLLAHSNIPTLMVH